MFFGFGIVGWDISEMRNGNCIERGLYIFYFILRIRERFVEIRIAGIKENDREWGDNIVRV